MIVATSRADDMQDYSALLRQFLDAGYTFVDYHHQSKADGEVILRHDIDYDTGFALETAKKEAVLGIQATYFFLLRSEFYNPYSEVDFRNIMEIKSLGHTISIHFDPLLYVDFHAGLAEEVSMFKAMFGEEVKMISLHRPNEYFQALTTPINGIMHTYMPRFFKELAYYADSTGKWRFGHPLDSEVFNQKKSLQLLIHPVWWCVPGEDQHEKLRHYFSTRNTRMKDLFSANCIPFRAIYDSI